MSLAQHVSSVEGADRGRGGPEEDDDSTKPLRRTLSYDAFPMSIAQSDDQTSYAAYKVSTTRRVAQVTITILSCWFAAGIVYGFAALKPVLVAEGVYWDQCEREELDIHGVCRKQDLRLNLFFTIGSVATNVAALPVGTILDRYGLRVCTVAGCVFLAVGCLLMGFASALPIFDCYAVGYSFLALGDTFIFVPSFQISNAFPRQMGTIVALVTGAFDASAAVFLFYRLAFEASNRTLTPHKFFLYYLTVPALILIAHLTLMPPRGYQTMRQLEKKMEKVQDVTRDVHDSDEEIEGDTELRRVCKNRENARRNKVHMLDQLMGDESERQQRADREEEQRATSGVWGALHGQPAHKQMISPWFILMTLLTVLQMLRLNYFIATIRMQYQYLLDSDARAVRINHFFDVALPVGGVVSTPFIGLLLDKLSVAKTLTVIVILITIIGALNCLPFYRVAFATVCIFVLLRPLYYSAMSDYTAKVFGFATFGRVYGTIICLSGLVNFALYGVDALTHGPFHGNPIPVNIAMTCTGFVVGLVLVLFVWTEGKRVRRRQLEENAEDEQLWLVPEVSDENEVSERE